MPVFPRFPSLATPPPEPCSPPPELHELYTSPLHLLPPRPPHPCAARPPKDLVNHFIGEVLNREAARRARVEVHVLMWVTRYGWDEQQEKDGTPFWVDRFCRQPRAFTMPVYTYKVRLVQ